MNSEIFLCLCLATLSASQGGQLLYLQPSLSHPEHVHQLGLSPRYHNIVYDYINQFAGQQAPTQVRMAVPATANIEEFGGGAQDEPELADGGTREPVTETPFKYPLQPSAMLPSDFILLARSPQSQFFGHFDLVKNKKMKLGTDPYAYPPVGGVVSNYVLQRNNLQDNKVKRQAFQYSYGSWPFNQGQQVQQKSYTGAAVGNRRSTYANIESDDVDDVVINAAAGPRADEPSKNCTNNSSSSSTTAEEVQPSVAQSKPQAIALAGAGGVAQAAPVATAVVGKEGLAIAAPSATAIAGQGAQNALGGGGEEKMKRRTSQPIKKDADEESQ